MTEKPPERVPSLKLVAADGSCASGADRAEPVIRDVDWAILMARAQDGDRGAYHRLLQEIAPYLRSLAARRHRDPNDAEDAVQDVLLTIHSIRQTYDPARPFGPWLVTIANRRLIDRLRRQVRVRARETPLTTEHETFSEPRANLGESTDRRDLEGAIAKLPPGQQQAVRLLKLKEMSLKEAAVASGMSITSLKVNTHRAEEPSENAGRSERAVIKTPDLIASLAANVTPVRRLRPPVMRAACWLLLAAIVLTLLAINQGMRPDLAQRLREPAFVICMAASLLTGVLAAIAAFLVSVPDRSRLWLLLPMPALVLWLSNIGYQCLVQWIDIGPNGISLGEAARCFATLVLTSLPLSLALLVMLRYAAPLRPTAITLMGSLAVAAITATALSLFHTVDATAMILMWNLGTAVLFVGLAGAFGRRMFRWVAPRSFDARD